MGKRVSPMEMENGNQKSSGCSCCKAFLIFVVIAALGGGLIALGVLYANQTCDNIEPTLDPTPVPTPTDVCLTKDCITAGKVEIIC